MMIAIALPIIIKKLSKAVLQILKMCVSIVVTPTTCQDKIAPCDPRMCIVQTIPNIIQYLLNNKEEI